MKLLHRAAATLARVSLSALVLAAPAAARAQWNPLNPVVSFQQTAHGVTITQKFGVLNLSVDSPSILHVTYAPLPRAGSGPAAPARPSDHVLVKNDWNAAKFTVDANDKAVVLSTADLKVVVERDTGAIHYFTDQGSTPAGATGPGSSGGGMMGTLLTTDAYRSLHPALVNGEKTYHAEVNFGVYGSHEGLYGLGQHQAGVWNYRGETIDLSQENTNIAVPLMLSTNGYGIFWNNPSRSRMNNRFVQTLYWSSEVADRIDYYFLYGPSADQIIGEYRRLTGEVPLFGRWAYGFWQCKNKYESQQEILGVAAKYRQLHIPVDNIVQDWFWWNTMGQMTWNKNYPDPKAMISTLHDEHFHLMVSVWPFFRPGSPNGNPVYNQFDKNGWFIAKTISPSFHPVGQALYDPTNPAARNQYWKNIDDALFKIGVDAWWLDTDEPETEAREKNILIDHQLHIGSGARYANIYPLFHSEGVSLGQQAASQQKRVFILSRSAYAGAQRLGVTAWSGDVLSDWLTFQRQIPAGLNYAMSGMPYWTTDIGGFISGGNLNDPKFRELFVRWFQFGVFSPVFRVHGTRNPDENELWSYGPDDQKILVNFDNLRYRLLPYIYSQAWQVTHNHGTLMRPLVMDWRTDVAAQNTGDEYMFGPAILVNPVYLQGATTRSVYLPAATWYDFWTGDKLQGPARIQAASPLSRLPLYVRAGSILPLGPQMEWSTQKPADPIELRIYPGADGDFTLYEDANDNYDYTHGKYATIPFHWNDATHTLTLGAREGSFPGMLQSRTFRIVLVGLNHGTGIQPTPTANKTITYTGTQMNVQP